MKKLLLFFVIVAAAAALTGCKDEPQKCETYTFYIINQLSDPVADIVAQTHSDAEPITIKPGEVKLFYSEAFCVHIDTYLDRHIPLSHAEMKIDGEVVPDEIWSWKHIEQIDGRDYHLTFFLIVTDELLKQVMSNT